MHSRKASLLVMLLLLLALPTYNAQSETSQAVEAFGDGFTEEVIATYLDNLDDPRDLEFHPGRLNELWIANRATDTITIIHNTGLDNQTSEHRVDSHRNHFLEEVSAIAFGAYHPEFDYQWGSAQESRNTYDGQASPNNFMGPALWPSSLSHFARENQNTGNGLLGSHIDMLHESPDGMGIAHDVGNVYWYNDGYYGELVRYDFQNDHDTGEHDHSDGIVQRFVDIQINRLAGVPGHMELDHDTGILYIADPAANRVIWANTEDTSVTKTDIMNDASRLEPLQEYSSMTGMEWGVLATGLDRPTGIALHEGQLFVSQYGNGKITAYELAENGKSGTFMDEIQTSASNIMGIEVGPNGHVYYVDNGNDEVVRIDPYEDEDGDGVGDPLDNCPSVPNASQANFDSDATGDACDNDDDNDGVIDMDDSCARGALDWTSSAMTDHDGDGCRDSSEDIDDDNDGIFDPTDACAVGDINWFSSSTTDYDNDGCQDREEDLDDDNDGICDDTRQDQKGDCNVSSVDVDLCQTSPLSFFSTLSSDIDRDGCEDSSEDLDDDNDGFNDDVDDCPTVAGASSQGSVLGCLDTDEDGYSDLVDVFPFEPTQWLDIDEDGFGDNIDGEQGDACVGAAGTSFVDLYGCPDSDDDGWSNTNDAFPFESSQQVDSDGDGYGDAAEGFQPDACPATFGTSTADRFGCVDEDEDEWSDLNDAFPKEPTQHLDSDGDGYGENPDGIEPDACPDEYGLSTQQRYGCVDGDGDGWDDSIDAYPNNLLLWSDTDDDGYANQQGTNISDDCPDIYGISNKDSLGCPDNDGDGWSNSADAYPEDATKHEAGGFASSPSYYIGLIFILLVVLLMYVGRRQGSSSEVDSAPVLQQPVPVVPTGPPLPPEGLPPGWTMDQWMWYGDDYINNR